MYYYILKSHPPELKGKALSLQCRKTLKNCCKKINITPPQTITIINHDFIQDLPQYCVSITHTKYIHATIIACKKVFLSIGIDIELKDRKVSPLIIKKIKHINDQYIDLLTLWTQKEAAFKALFPLHEEIKFLNDFWVKESEFGIAKESLGKLVTEEIVYENKTIILSIAAYLKK